MPAIAGLVNPDLSTRLPACLESMAQRLRREPFQAGEQRVGGRAGLFGIGRSGERILSARAGVWLVLLGSIVQQDELAANLRRSGIRTDNIRTQSDLVLELFLAFGPRFVAHLNGDYALAIWEESEQRLTLVRDRLGSTNLYLWENGSSLAFSSEYKAFTGLPGFSQEVDEAAVADLIAYHQVMGDRTFFRSARMLPPGTLLVWQNGQVGFESQWDWMDRWGTQQDTRSNLVDGFADHLSEAVRRRIHPNSALLLTGGLDSRSIAGMVHSIDPTLGLRTMTVGTEHSTDVRIARQIARALGYEHEQLALNDRYLALYGAQAAWRAEGKLNTYASWIYAAEARLRSRGVQQVLTGVIGNPVNGRHYPAEFALPLTKTQVGKLLEVIIHQRRQDIDRVMHKRVAARAVEVSQETFLRYFRDVEPVDLYASYDAFYFGEVIPRLAHGMEVLGEGARPLDPFFDHDLVAYALQMPSSVRVGGRFFKEMIARYLPEVSALEHGRTGRTVNQDLLVEQSPLGIPLADSARRRVTRRVQVHFQSADDEPHGSVPYNRAILDGSRDLVSKALSRVEYLEDIFDMKAVEGVLADHMSRRRFSYSLIDAIVTFSLWRQQTSELPRTGVEVQSPSLPFRIGV